ncbi:MAG: hypothetical protein U5R31_04630 [Acidimicrobiia bacterium]|nr:hypothetical protein [Acidimicrobiia bacterium]
MSRFERAHRFLTLGLFGFAGLVTVVVLLDALGVGGGAACLPCSDPPALTPEDLAAIGGSWAAAGSAGKAGDIAESMAGGPPEPPEPHDPLEELEHMDWDEVERNREIHELDKWLEGRRGLEGDGTGGTPTEGGSRPENDGVGPTGEELAAEIAESVGVDAALEAATKGNTGIGGAAVTAAGGAAVANEGYVAIKEYDDAKTEAADEALDSRGEIVEPGETPGDSDSSGDDGADDDGGGGDGD